MRTSREPAVSGGYAEMEAALRGSAYEVSYFFEYVGVLVAFGMIPADLIVGTMATSSRGRGTP